MSLITFSSLRTTLIQESQPAGESPRHVAGNTRIIKDGLIELQGFVRGLTDRQYQVYPYNSTFYDCKKSLIVLPPKLQRSQIMKVYTVANQDWCDTVEYLPKTKKDVFDWAKNLVDEPSGTPSIRPAFMYGVTFPTSNFDSTAGRARQGCWVKENGKLWVAPYLQSYEALVVEYKGVKRIWNDADVIDDEIWTTDIISGLVKYLVWKREVKYGSDPELRRQAEADWREAEALLLHFDKEEDIPGDQEVVPRRTSITQAEDANDAAKDVTSEDITVEIMAVGDLGTDNENTSKVAQLMKQFNPDNILLLGDINYDGGAPETYENVLLKYWDGYLDKIIPVWGNHDLEFSYNGVYGGAMLALFPDIADLNSNKLYYSKQVGPITFWVVNSGFTDADPREPDGITEASTQGTWLQAGLAASTSPWNVVCIHRTPYTSDETCAPGITTLRWPFKSWGADLVLQGHGHNFEHIYQDTLDYIQVGTGGATLRDFYSPRLSNSQMQIGEHGALRIIGTSSTLQCVFYSVAGDVRSNIYLTQ